MSILIFITLSLALGLRAYGQTERITNGSFEQNAYSTNQLPIQNWELRPNINNGNDNAMTWMPGSSWRRLGFATPDLHESADRVPPPSNPNNNVITFQRTFHLLGCHPTTCHADEVMTNDIDAWEGNYFVGLGGCEGIIQQLATPIVSGSQISITLRYAGRCAGSFNFPIIVGLNRGDSVNAQCVYQSRGIDVSNTINTTGNQPCNWYVYSQALVYTGSQPLTHFYIYVPSGCTGRDTTGVRTDCYYYIDGVSVISTPPPPPPLTFLTDDPDRCATCSQCAVGDPYVSIPTGVGSQTPYVIRHL
jgi:hypothetical protein